MMRNSQGTGKRMFKIAGAAAPLAEQPLQLYVIKSTHLLPPRVDDEGPVNTGWVQVGSIQGIRRGEQDHSARRIKRRAMVQAEGYKNE